MARGAAKAVDAAEAVEESVMRGRDGRSYRIRSRVDVNVDKGRASVRVDDRKAATYVKRGGKWALDKAEPTPAGRRIAKSRVTADDHWDLRDALDALFREGSMRIASSRPSAAEVIEGASVTVTQEMADAARDVLRRLPRKLSAKLVDWHWANNAGEDEWDSFGLALVQAYDYKHGD